MRSLTMWSFGCFIFHTFWNGLIVRIHPLIFGALAGVVFEAFLRRGDSRLAKHTMDGSATLDLYRTHLYAR
jgi:hypothetical protein